MHSRAAIRAVADALANPENAELTAEEVAERVISAYEEAQAKTHNLIVLGHFRLEDDTSFVAAVGPLSTRATARARAVGERFAWDYKTRRGTGKFVLVPLIRDVNQAWDEARRGELDEYTTRLSSVVPGVDLTYEPMRFDFDNEALSKITPDWVPSEGVLATKYGPSCRCGKRREPWVAAGGGADDGTCQLHPEGRTDGSAGAG